MKKPSILFSSVVSLLCAWSLSQPAQAQSSTSSTTSGGGTSSSGVQQGPGTTTTTTSYNILGVPNATTDINAGLPSSSRPSRNGAADDKFDMRPSGSSGKTVHGDSDSIISDGFVNPGEAGPNRAVPAIHTVAKGDTLWELCSRYFANPWNWPKVWATNPQIQNPHWIYPGDQLRLREGGTGPGDTGAMGGRDRSHAHRRVFVPDSVLTQETGYIDDPEDDIWGMIQGGPDVHQMLADQQVVYVKLKGDHEAQEGDLLSVFRIVGDPEKVPGGRTPPGKVVRIIGELVVTDYDKDTHIARGRMKETSDYAERGYMVGKLDRELKVIEPKENQKALWARVLRSTYPLAFFGQNDVIFLDRGFDDGLEPGNRMLILRRGDEWVASLSRGDKMTRAQIWLDTGDHAPLRATPLEGDVEDYPEEVVAEVRVLFTRRYTSLALILEARLPIEPGDRVYAPGPIVEEGPKN